MDKNEHSTDYLKLDGEIFASGSKEEYLGRIHRSPCRALVMEMFKRMFFATMELFFSRQQIFRLSRALMNRALGDNNDDMKSNGELFLLYRILSLIQKDHKLVVFDVGANIGHWTVSLLDIAEEMAIDGLTVYSFEPSLIAFSEFQANLAKHPMAQSAHAVSVGMSNTPGDKTLYINKDGAGTNSLYKRRTESLGIIYDKTETIQTTTLDIYCSERDISHVDFLKVDVEGHELAVMQGAVDMLKQQAIDYIQFEYGGTWIDSRTLFLDMYDLLTSFNYSVGKILPKGIEFFDKYDERMESFQMANFLACRPNRISQFKQIKSCLR